MSQNIVRALKPVLQKIDKIVDKKTSLLLLLLYSHVEVENTNDKLVKLTIRKLKKAIQF